MTSRPPTSIAAAVAVGLGLLAGAGTVGTALADAPATVPDDPVETTEPSESGAGDTTATDADVGPARWYDETLARLVADGILTEEQAAAVADALAADGPWLATGRHLGAPGVAIGLGALTDALDVTPAELLAAFAEGDSIADVAAAHGVDVQTVIDALVAVVSDRLDTAVANGRLTEEEAAERLESATERITELVDEPGGPDLPRPPVRPGGPDVDWPGPQVHDLPGSDDHGWPAPVIIIGDEPGTVPESSVEPTTPAPPSSET